MLEHVDTSNSKTLRSSECFSSVFLVIRPVISSSSIEKNRYEKEVDQALARFLHVRRIRGSIPPGNERFYAGMSCVKVPPASMRRDLRVIDKIATFFKISRLTEAKLVPKSR